MQIGDARGGMTTRSSEIENYPGFYRISGASLMRLFADQAEEAGAVILDDVVTDFSVRSGLFFVETLSGRAFTAKAVIAASGKTPKLSGIPGEAELFGEGVSICTTCDGPFFKGKQVAVYDGGNTAADMALEMSDIASVVYLISRSPLKADAVTIDPLKEKKNVVIETGVVIPAFAVIGRCLPSTPPRRAMTRQTPPVLQSTDCFSVSALRRTPRCLRVPSA